jgi:hypothetical protein
MTIIHRKKQVDSKNAIGSIVAGVAGAVAIAGAAVVTTMALKDEKSRKKTRKMLIDAKDQALDYVETLKIESNDGEEAHAIKKIATDTKKAVKKSK